MARSAAVAPYYFFFPPVPDDGGAFTLLRMTVTPVESAETVEMVTPDMRSVKV